MKFIKKKSQIFLYELLICQKLHKLSSMCGVQPDFWLQKKLSYRNKIV